MYYKITNKECHVYKQLYKMRTREIEFDICNRFAVEEKVKLPFDKFFGQGGQQNYHRVKIYRGFCFNDPEKVDKKVFSPLKDSPDTFIPNKRTKLGREMEDFLNNKLKTSWFTKPLDILQIPHENYTTFRFPFVEIVNDTIVVYLDDKFIPENINVIEITKKEFDEILSNRKKKTP